MTKITDKEYKVYKYYHSGMSLSDIADMLHMDSGEVRSLFKTATEKLWQHHMERKR